MVRVAYGLKITLIPQGFVKLKVIQWFNQTSESHFQALIEQS